MPLYSFQRKRKIWEEMMTYDELQTFLKDNPDVNQIFHTNGFLSSHGLKPDEGFRDLLREMNKFHKKRGGQINTFD